MLHHDDTSRSLNLNSERRRRLFLSIHVRKTQCTWKSVFSGRQSVPESQCSQEDRAYLKVSVLRKAELTWKSVFSGRQSVPESQCSQEDRAYLKVSVLRKVNTESPVPHVHHLVKVSYGVKCVSVANVRVHSTGILASETLIVCRAAPGVCAV
jgi:hypothetical protein